MNYTAKYTTAIDLGNNQHVEVTQDTQSITLVLRSASTLHGNVTLDRIVGHQFTVLVTDECPQENTHEEQVHKFLRTAKDNIQRKAGLQSGHGAPYHKQLNLTLDTIVQEVENKFACILPVKNYKIKCQNIPYVRRTTNPAGQTDLWKATNAYNAAVMLNRYNESVGGLTLDGTNVAEGYDIAIHLVNTLLAERTAIYQMQLERLTNWAGTVLTPAQTLKVLNWCKTYLQPADNDRFTGSDRSYYRMLQHRTPSHLKSGAEFITTLADTYFQEDLSMAVKFVYLRAQSIVFATKHTETKAR